MNAHRCTQPLEAEQMIAYQLGELSSEAEAQVEEHYFGCESCSRRLEGLEQLGREVVRAVREGRVTAPVTAALLERAEAEGLKLRRYRLAPGESVACTAMPEDDFVIVNLAGELHEHASVSMHVETLDLEHDARVEQVLRQVPVDHSCGEVFLMFPGPLVRSYPRSRWTMRLAVEREESESERPPSSLGTFTMHHTPWQQLGG